MRVYWDPECCQVYFFNKWTFLTNGLDASGPIYILRETQGVNMKKNGKAVMFMTSTDITKLLGFAKQTLCLWRKAGRGPKHVKIGGRMLYRVTDFLEWVKQEGHCIVLDKDTGTFYSPESIDDFFNTIRDIVNFRGPNNEALTRQQKDIMMQEITRDYNFGRIARKKKRGKKYVSNE